MRNSEQWNGAIDGKGVKEKRKGATVNCGKKIPLVTGGSQAGRQRSIGGEFSHLGRKNKSEKKHQLGKTKGGVEFQNVGERRFL